MLPVFLRDLLFRAVESGFIGLRSCQSLFHRATFSGEPHARERPLATKAEYVPVPSRLLALSFDGVSPQLRRHFFTRQAFEK
jgi:hypothetical protein